MTRITIHTLQHFHEYWWGNDNFLGANTVIHLPVFSDLYIFAFTGSRLLVRKEYLYIFKRLQDFCQTPRYYARAIILDGHPGIGKSMFLFYALIRCLQESRDVIFYFSHRTLKFSKDGVQEIDLNNFISYPSIHSPIWCLIDSCGREGPPLDLIGAFMFPILASSRSDEPFSGWAQRNAASRLVMNPWSDEEICIGTELLSRDQATLVLYQSLLPQVLNFCGPIIQDIYICLSSQGSTTILDYAYGPHPSVASPASLTQVLTAFHCSTWDNVHIPCSTALMFRRPAPNAGACDDAYLDFRSPRLAQQARDQLIHLGYETAKACFSLFRDNTTQTVAGQWLFEVIVRTQIRQEFREMSLVEGTRTFIDPDVRNYHYLPIRGTTRTPVFYSSATEILRDTTSFYIPRKVTKDSMFNGLFFGYTLSPDYSGPTRVTPDPTVLYILRTTTEAKNAGSELGVECIYEILHRYPGLVLVYLLVAPLPGPGYTYDVFLPKDDRKSSWTMPQSWFQKCPGRVFFQLIQP